jgi:sodium/hydrogen exchanger 8
VFLGAIIGLVGKVLNQNGKNSYIEEEMLSPQAFFVILLPPIIFEAGYSLHKGNFFQNLGSICVFAIIGTIISTFFVGTGMRHSITILFVYKDKMAAIRIFYRKKLWSF